MKPIQLSHTKIAMYLKCPRQFAYRYVENLKLPPSGAMKLGGSFHTTVEHNYRQKASTLKDLLLSEQTDFFADTWKDELEREEVVFDKEKGETAGSLKDAGVAIVAEHHKKIAPKVMPASEDAVEEWIKVPLAKGDVSYELVARLDLTDKDGVIRDNKATTRGPSQADADRDIQLSTYALARRLQTKQPERGLALDVIVKNKTPKALTISTERTREHLQLHLRDTIGHVAKGIAAESFPMNPTTFWCSPKWCGYWDRCMGKVLKTVDVGEHLAEQLENSIEVENGKRTEQPAS